MSTTPTSPGPTTASRGGVSAPAAGVKSLLPFDILRVLLAVLRGWKWMLAAGLLGGGAAFALGWSKFTTKYTVQVQLVRQETQNNFQASKIGESFKPRQFNAATVSSMMRAGSLMEKTGGAVSPPLTAGQLQRDIVIRPEKNTDLITVAWTEEISPAHAVETINRYAADVVELTRTLQAGEAKELLGFITAQVERTESELAAVQKELMAFSRSSGLFNADKETESYLKQIGELDLRIQTARIEHESNEYRLSQTEQELAKQNPSMQRLKDAQARLAEMLTQYTAQHPTVVEQMARVAALEKSSAPAGPDAAAAFQSSGNTIANSLYLDILTFRANKESLVNEINSLRSYRDVIKAKLDTIPDKSLGQARIKARAASLDETRSLLGGRQREAQLFAENAPGYYRLFAPATADAIEVSSRFFKIALVTLAGAVLATLGIAALRALRATLDDRIVSPSDVRRLTKTPVVATLTPEENLDPAALARWQFATWASLVRFVPAPSDGAMIVGLLSAEDGAGKSTWLRHLGRAALDRGLKVIVVTHGDPTGAENASAPLQTGLSDPADILTHLRTAEPAAVELNAPSTWQWTAASRHLWREALAVWSHEPGLAVLVELPAAAELDSLLLAETLPAILWLSNSGTLSREQVTGILDTIRQSGVPLIGSLLNRIPPIFQRLPDLSKFGLCLAAALTLSTLPATAGDDERDPTPPPAENGLRPPIANPVLMDDIPSASGIEDHEPSLLPDEVPPPALPAATDLPPKRLSRAPIPVPKPDLAPWQQRLTLGPGDIVNLQVYGRKEYTRTGVPIGPDGNLSYLQVTSYPAAGQTIDEIRDGLTLALREYIQNARIIITPGAYRSKKYFMLGTIMDRGSYTLDRPMTLLEAAARARGIATGLMEQNTVEIADMRRAFIVRDGKKLDVDFTKLFYEGDTTQNIPLYPGDYIYFPSNVVNELYILGAVSSPGQAGVTENLTVLGAITKRGGFAPTAYQKKILVVRGTMDQSRPEVYVVDAAAVLAGKEKDIVLQPRDLVYVGEKPWQKAADIFDTALRAFVQTGTATWTGGNIGPILKEPLLPSLNNP